MLSHGIQIALRVQPRLTALWDPERQQLGELLFRYRTFEDASRGAEAGRRSVGEALGDRKAFSVDVKVELDLRPDRGSEGLHSLDGLAP